jgi:hypothetical protein
MANVAEFDKLEDLLEQHIPEPQLKEVWRILYGSQPR